MRTVGRGGSGLLKALVRIYTITLYSERWMAGRSALLLVFEVVGRCSRVFLFVP